MTLCLNRKAIPIKSNIYDLGFILSYVTAQVYHFFEYFQNDYAEKVLFVFLLAFHYLAYRFFKAIKNCHIESSNRFFFYINLLFIFFCSLLLFHIINHWPYGANHTNFNTFLLFLIFVFYFVNFIKYENIYLNLFENKIFLLSALVILYYSAALHKMNVDFYNPDKSCTTWYHLKLFSRFFNNIDLNDIPVFIKSISPKIVGALELLAPTLLLMKRYRNYGLLMLLFLHSYLALGGFADFSSLAMALLFLFLPLVISSFDVWIKIIYLHFISSYVLIGISLIGAYVFPEIKQTLQSLQGLILIVITMNLIYLSSKHIIKRHSFERYLNFSSIDTLKLGPLILLCLFSTSIYFGYRSAGNFTMFSNLKFAGSYNNHFFMKKIDLFGYESELYQVLSSYDESIFTEVRQTSDWITKSGLDLAYERARKLDKLQNFNLIVKSESGEIHKLTNLNIKQFLGPKKSWFFYKTYNYSFIANADNINSCRW